MTPQFPESPETIQATLARVLELQGASGDAQVVRMAQVTIQHLETDNWRGGTDFYQLGFRVPLEVFVQLQPQIEEQEKRLLAVVTSTWRDLESDVLSSVRISPERGGHDASAGPASEQALPQFWEPSHFRLFVSHCASERAAVGQLKLELQALGVTAFVAHDDVEPSTLWQVEIERALRSAEALTAVVSPDFLQSKWCDQEVGVALGRGVVVLPVAWGADPHGFIGKIQALPVARGQPLSRVAGPIVSLLLKSPRTSVSMTNALVAAVAGSSSYAIAKATTALLEQAPALTSAHAGTLVHAAIDNSQVSEAFGVPGRIAGILLRHGFK